MTRDPIIDQTRQAVMTREQRLMHNIIVHSQDTSAQICNCAITDADAGAIRANDATRSADAQRTAA